MVVSDGSQNDTCGSTPKSALLRTLRLSSGALVKYDPRELKKGSQKGILAIFGSSGVKIGSAGVAIGFLALLALLALSCQMRLSS